MKSKLFIALLICNALFSYDHCEKLINSNTNRIITHYDTQIVCFEGSVIYKYIGHNTILLNNLRCDCVNNEPIIYKKDI